MKALLAAVVAICLMAPAMVHAQQAYFGPQLGFFNARDGDATQLMGGLALRLRLSRAFGIEGSVNYRREEYDDGHVAVRSWPVMVTALLYPFPMVYGAIGAGWYNTSIEYDNTYLGVLSYSSTETKQDFGWHFGAGVDLPVGERTHLVGDVRYVFLDYGFREFPGSGGANSDFYVVTVGLLFRL